MAKKSSAQNTGKGRPAAQAAPAKQPAPSRAAQPLTDNNSFFARNSQFFIVAGIAIITYLCYMSCLENGLTNWDDLGYIKNNPLIKDTGPDAIKNIFSTAHPVMGNYHPLTILLYYFEYQRYGLQPWIYHFDSVLLHILVTIAVYIFIKVLSGRTVAATVAALLFGLHPMHVESVAWAAGRKDIIYGLFFILSCTTWIYYIRTTGSKRIGWYVAGLVLFALSLLAKSVAVTLPVTLFLVDFYEGRIQKPGADGWVKSYAMLLVEKLPHFGLALLFGILSVQAQKDVGAMTLDVKFSGLERLALGCYAFCCYLWKAIVPTGLSNFYPYPLKISDALPGQYYIFIAVVATFFFAVFWWGRKNKAVLFGVGFLVINILLLLQFIPVGGAIISDRYGYIPYLGLFFIAGWFISGYFEQEQKRQTGKILLGVLVACSLVFGYLTSERCKDWYDSVSLWRDDIDKHPEAPVGYFYLGQDYFERFEKATNPVEKKAFADSCLNNFNLSVLHKPDYINPIICIAELQRSTGAVDAAKTTYFQALAISKTNESVYLGLGVVYAIRKQYDSSRWGFETALKLKKFLPEGYSNYANFLDIMGKTDSSLAMYAVSISQNPDAFIPYMNRGRIYYRLKKYDEALKDYNKALELNPLSAECYYLRARALASKGNKAQAIQDVEKSKSLGYTQIDPAFLQQLR